MSAHPFRIYGPAFALAAVAASVAASVSLMLLGGADPYGTVAKLVIGLAAATLVCLPFVLVAGLLVALPVERLFLRHANDARYFVTAVGAGAVSGLIAEQIVFQAPYRSFGSTLLPAMLAALAAAVVWRQKVRTREAGHHA